MEYGLRALTGASDALPDRVAISDQAMSLTWAELSSRVRMRASEVTESAPVGGHVGIALEAGCNWAVAFFGCLVSGRVAVPLESALDDQSVESLRSICDHIISDPSSSSSEATELSLPPDGASAVVLLTSGTTAGRKPVVLSHGNLRAHAAATRLALDGGQDDRWLSSLPLSHTGGIGVLIRCLEWGATAVLRAHWDAEEAKELLLDDEAAITLVSLVPTTLGRLVDAGLSSPRHLRRAIIGGAPLSAHLRARAIDAGIPVVESWGLTQSCGMVAVARDPSVEGVGRAIDGITIKVSPSGELLLSGETISSQETDSGGFLHTGDLGHFDEENLVIDGRLSSVVITGGENVLPERVEARALEHPMVVAALAYGVPDEEWGQRLVIDVVARKPRLSADELLSHLRSHLARFEVPKEIRFVDGLPLGPSGKPVRPNSTDARR